MPRPNASAVSRQPPPLTKLHLTSIAAQPIKSKANVPIRSEMYFRYESINRQLLFIYLSAKRLPFTDRREAPSSIDAGGGFGRACILYPNADALSTHASICFRSEAKRPDVSLSTTCRRRKPLSTPRVYPRSISPARNRPRTQAASTATIIKPVRSDIFAMRILSM